MTERQATSRDFVRARPDDELYTWLADPLLQRKAAHELGRRRNRPALAKLIDLLDSPEPLVREAAADALGNIGDRRAGEKLTAVLVREGEPREVRDTCAFALARIGFQPAFDVLVAALADPDVTVRVCVAAALAAIDTPAALDVLANAASWEPDAHARGQMLEALRRTPHWPVRLPATVLRTHTANVATEVFVVVRIPESLQRTFVAHAQFAATGVAPIIARLPDREPQRRMMDNTLSLAEIENTRLLRGVGS